MEHVDITQAHNELMEELFGISRDKRFDPYKPIKRSVYTKAMKKVQDKHGLKQGHPDFMGWIFTCIGNSPIIIEDEEGAE